MNQTPHEKCKDFLRRLQIKAASCNFICDSCKSSTKEKRIKEKFILGINNKTIQTHILKTESIKPGTPLNQIVTEAITLEQSILDQASISNDLTSSVCATDGLECEHSNDDEVHAMSKATSFSRNSSKVDKPLVKTIPKSLTAFECGICKLFR